MEIAPKSTAEHPPEEENLGGTPDDNPEPQTAPSLQTSDEDPKTIRVEGRKIYKNRETGVVRKIEPVYFKITPKGKKEAKPEEQPASPEQPEQFESNPEQQSGDLERILAELTALRSEIDNLREENASMAAELRALRGEMANLREENEALKKENAGLKKPNPEDALPDSPDIPPVFSDQNDDGGNGIPTLDLTKTAVSAVFGSQGYREVRPFEDGMSMFQRPGDLSSEPPKGLEEDNDIDDAFSSLSEPEPEERPVEPAAPEPEPEDEDKNPEENHLKSRKRGKITLLGERIRERRLDSRMQRYESLKKYRENSQRLLKEAKAGKQEWETFIDEEYTPEAKANIEYYDREIKKLERRIRKLDKTMDRASNRGTLHGESSEPESDI